MAAADYDNWPQPDDDIKIDGKILPRVKEYPYLGIVFNDELDLSKMIAARVKKIAHPTKGTRSAIRRFVGSKNAPLELRIMVIKAVLLPALCYGGELFGLRGFNGQRNQLIAPLENILNTAIFMLSKASWSTNVKLPALTAIRVFRKELGIPSVEACMAGRAARALAKFPTSKCMVHKLFKHNPPSKNFSWTAMIDKNYTKLLKWYGIAEVNRPTTQQAWTGSAVFKSSKAAKTVAKYGNFGNAVWEALAKCRRGPNYHPPASNEAISDAAKEEGRRIQLLMEEWYLRNQTPRAVKYMDRYIKSNVSRTSPEFIKVSAIYPKLSAGFHWLSRIRSGRFFDWPAVCQLTKKVTFRSLASDLDSTSCPCCKQPGTADAQGQIQPLDSLEHFYFDCTAPQIVKVRNDLRFTQRAILLTDEVCYASREGEDPRLVQADLLASSRTNILLGGNRVIESSGVERRGGVLGLKGWKLGKDKTPDQELLQAEVKSFLSDYRSGRELTKWQKKFTMLEAGFALQAAFLQQTMKFRNECMWGKPDPAVLADADVEDPSDDEEDAEEEDIFGTGASNEDPFDGSDRSIVGSNHSSSSQSQPAVGQS